jgi:hypothetical protein
MRPSQWIFSREEHEQLAESILNVLDGVEAIHRLLHVPGAPAGASAPWRCDPRARELTVNLGQAAKSLQYHLERLLARAEASGHRSWDLYFPRDRKAAHVTYSSSEKRT